MTDLDTFTQAFGDTQTPLMFSAIERAYPDGTIRCVRGSKSSTWMVGIMPTFPDTPDGRRDHERAYFALGQGVAELDAAERTIGRRNRLTRPRLMRQVSLRVYEDVLTDDGETVVAPVTVTAFGVELRETLGGGLNVGVETLATRRVPVERYADDARDIGVLFRSVGVRPALSEDIALLETWMSFGLPECYVVGHPDHIHLFATKAAADAATEDPDAAQFCDLWAPSPAHSPLTVLAVTQFPKADDKADTAPSWTHEALTNGACAVVISGQIETRDSLVQYLAQRAMETSARDKLRAAGIEGDITDIADAALKAALRQAGVMLDDLEIEMLRSSDTEAMHKAGFGLRRVHAYVAYPAQYEEPEFEAPLPSGLRAVSMPLLRHDALLPFFWGTLDQVNQITHTWLRGELGQTGASLTDALGEASGIHVATTVTGAVPVLVPATETHAVVAQTRSVADDTARVISAQIGIPVASSPDRDTAITWLTTGASTDSWCAEQGIDRSAPLWLRDRRGRAHPVVLRTTPRTTQERHHHVF